MKICVYGAASNTIDKKYIDNIEILGEKLAQRGHSLVFGAGANGSMGAVARGVFRKDGYIIGIAPSFFNVDGVLFEKCNELYRPETMRERKRMLDEMSEAFIITPGGIGTFDEFFEILTLRQLGRHEKAIVIYNIDGYFDKLIEFLEFSVEKNFIKDRALELFMVTNSPDEVLDYIESYDADFADVKKMKNITEE